ncbi:DIS3-like exonuclease 2 isoform X2 [Halyomorpha halys]|uniref:DIS3-like exonuclease 2 isoform X2 n=1 Tax=Halyomorpha halys TaxID=286706 RepID=UPI0006D4CDCA|nr:DIS3-like exonuclease 2 isoform X2 [Halyomorpha halys]
MAMDKNIPLASSPVNIPHPLAMKTIPSKNIFHNFPPAVAASAPTETIPYVDMLLNSSTERRSLSPHRKNSGLPNERVRVLSCSDLESTLTSRSQDSFKYYQDFPPPPPIPIFHHLPPIQACSPPQYVQQQGHRMPVGRNFPPLILGQQGTGFPIVGKTEQQMNRTIQPPVRPPPGFEVPMLNTPPSPHTPPQFPSPQPWSPARLAPMFHRNESSELNKEPEIKSPGGGAKMQSTPKPYDPKQNNKYVEHTNKQKHGKQKTNGERTQAIEHSEGWDLWDVYSAGIKPVEIPNSNESASSSGMKEKKKKKRQKKDKNKLSNSFDQKSQPPSTDSFYSENTTTTAVDKYRIDTGEFKEDWSQDDLDSTPNGVIFYTEEEEEKEGEKLRKLKKKFKSQKRFEKFEPYLTLEEVENGLADKTLIEAEIRINYRNYKEAFVTDLNEGQDILIYGLKDRNRALDGDIVVIQVKERAQWTPLRRGGQSLPHKSGKVVYIKERVHHRNTVGSLHRIDHGILTLMPRDPRFPILRIRPQSVPLNVLDNINTMNGDRILFKASIVSWVTTAYANGIIKKNIGHGGILSNETAAILDELGLDQKPVPHFKKLVPSLPYEIPEEELTSRLDLRSEVIFTIDPPTARDLDDAVSIKKLNDDTYQVGVHISDVTHFLQEGTKLDRMVSNRATTIYMVEQAFHMLPLTLCGLCSLNPGEDKLAISVIMNISKDGVVLDKEFKRSVIHSCAQLTYDQVQDVIDGKEADFPEIHNNVEVAAIKEAILQLHELAVVIRTKRFDSGALKIDQPKLYFSLDESNDPKSLAVYEIKDSNKLIEEFMLLANESVASFIHEKAPDVALLRRHDPPKHGMMEKLVKNLNEIGICLDSSSAGSLHSSLSKYCEGDEMKAHVLYHLCARPMKRAVYFCSSSDTHHFALNKDIYTHFTSPIRRYADIIVHRILTACLGLTPMPAWDADKINKFASVCNRKKYCAKRANELSCDMFRILYFKSIQTLIAEAVVLQVTSFGIHVIVPSLAYVARICYEDLEDIKYTVRNKEMNTLVKITWPGLEEVQELKIFSKVKVLLVYMSTKLDNPEIACTLVPPPNSPS